MLIFGRRNQTDAIRCASYLLRRGYTETLLMKPLLVIGWYRTAVASEQQEGRTHQLSLSRMLALMLVQVPRLMRRQWRLFFLQSYLECDAALASEEGLCVQWYRRMHRHIFNVLSQGRASRPGRAARVWRGCRRMAARPIKTPPKVILIASVWPNSHRICPLPCTFYFRHIFSGCYALLVQRQKPQRQCRR